MVNGGASTSVIKALKLVGIELYRIIYFYSGKTDNIIGTWETLVGIIDIKLEYKLTHYK